MSHLADHHKAVLDGKPVPYHDAAGKRHHRDADHHDRVAAVWAEAHDHAAKELGSAPAFFGDQDRSRALMADLEDAGPDATVDALRKVAHKHLTAAVKAVDDRLERRGVRRKAKADDDAPKDAPKAHDKGGDAA